MTATWSTTLLTTKEQVFQTCGELMKMKWICRGQSKEFACLLPTIDRNYLVNLSRQEKLSLEHSSIERFRLAAKDFCSEGEERAKSDDIVALMVLRHYGVPTRLLDWSISPVVATCFAVNDNFESNAELWAFDYERYVVEGTEQWKNWPETTTDHSGTPELFDAKLTAFATSPPPWFICVFYPHGFPRHLAQQSLYSMTAEFGVDHAIKIASLLKDSNFYRRFVIERKLKKEIKELLWNEYGVGDASLFPDVAGAANFAKMVFRQWDKSDELGET